jgi:3-hydroxybutyryl-CoA dehydratase
MPERLQNIPVGNRLAPRSYGVDQATVDGYAEVSGDHNPLHTDPDFAATTHFGRTIAHGMMTLCFLSDSMEVWAGKSWATAGTLDVTFLSPVYPGEMVTVTLTIAGNDGARVGAKVECSAEDRVVLVGEVSVPASEMAG